MVGSLVSLSEPPLYLGQRLDKDSGAWACQTGRQACNLRSAGFQANAGGQPNSPQLAQPLAGGQDTKTSAQWTALSSQTRAQLLTCVTSVGVLSSVL